MSEENKKAFDDWLEGQMDFWIKRQMKKDAELAERKAERRRIREAKKRERWQKKQQGGDSSKCQS